MTKITVVKKLSNKGYPVHSPNYLLAHRAANVVEKKSDPAAYNEITKLDRKLSKNELAGKHTKSGKIEIESKFTKSHNRISGKRIKRNLIRHEVYEKKKEDR
jgi:hypothetical protein